MSIPYTQPTIANVNVGSGTFISYPFLTDGDTTTKVYNMACSQRASDYAANQVALDDTMSSASAAGVIALPFAADSSAYFVGDTGHAPSDGGMIKFTRRFANIPQATTKFTGTQNHTFPGWQNRNPSHFEPPSPINVYPSRLWHYLGNRSPQNIASPASTETSYILLGVTLDGDGDGNVINNVDDIELPPAFQPWNKTDSQPTELLDEIYTSGVNIFTKQTVPTRSDYIDMIDNKDEIIIESSIKTWLGNILEKKIKKITAS